MPDTDSSSARTLSEAILLQRLEAFESNRAFFIDMWLQNPSLARQAGERVQALLRPLPRPRAPGTPAKNEPQ